ncbi:hypothetical protein KUCAC02_026544, partial [Chaenocephalus aceratus]
RGDVTLHRPQPLSLKQPGIMRGTRRSARTQGEQSTALKHLLRTGSIRQLWLTPRRLRISVKVRSSVLQLKTPGCPTRLMAPQRRTGTLRSRRRRPAAPWRAPAT